MIAALAFVAALASAQEPSPLPPPGQLESGFAVEVGAATQQLLIGDSDVIGFSTLRGTLMLGYKAGPLLVGVGFELISLTDSESSDGADFSVSSTSLAIVPGIRFAFARSADHRAELFGALDLGIGTMWESRSGSVCDMDPSVCESDQSVTRYVYGIGPGVRYWMHPQVALVVTSGIRGDILSVSRDGSDRTDTVHILGFSASIGLLGLF